MKSIHANKNQKKKKQMGVHLARKGSGHRHIAKVLFYFNLLQCSAVISCIHIIASCTFVLSIAFRFALGNELSKNQ